MREIKIGLIFIFAFFLLVSPSFAHEEGPEVETKQAIRYDLPYPGLLPNNPLYFLKATRDRIVSFLISDPLKKAEFNLLTADKRLNAGLYLFNKNTRDIKNIMLSESTISKGENYFHQAIQELKQAKKEGINIEEVAGKLLTSSKKHHEVIRSIARKISGNKVRIFLALSERVEDFEKEVSSLLPKR